MNAITITDRDERVKAVREAGLLNGIAYLEVVSADQCTLVVHFIAPLPGETGGIPMSPLLSIENIRIDGGVRVQNIRAVSLAVSGAEMTLTVDKAGDFSPYRLGIVTSPFDCSQPPGFDPIVSSLEFSFKVGCPAEFDCISGRAAREKEYKDLPINYLAKDYHSFRRLMLERLNTLMPQWVEKNPADIGIMLVELLAYEADQLSYYQDSVATEAYLGTARQRPSLRRHARLLDYAVHDGCNARTWVQICVSPGGDLDGKTLPLGTPCITIDGQGHEPRIDPDNVEKEVPPNAIVFETKHSQPLYSAHNAIDIYTWSESSTCLAKGDTMMTLYNDPSLSIIEGDVLILEQVRSPLTGNAADADPLKRHAVRVIGIVPDNDPLTNAPVLKVEWHSQDALPFDMCILTEVDFDGVPQKLPITIARGNVVLADHGKHTTDPSALSVTQVPADAHYEPRLSVRTISFAQPYMHHLAMSDAASTMLAQDPRKARASLWMHDGNSAWIVQSDLLASDRFAEEFVVETNDDRTVNIRFGDSIHGKQPAPGTLFTPMFRIGNGRKGNVGADTITRIVTDFRDITSIRNPLPARGGTEPEPAEDIRRYAPEAFRVQKRAVIESDHAHVAQLFPEVQRAKAHFRWTGSWYTVFISIDRFEGRAVSTDSRFVDNLRQHMEAYRMAGYDIKICDPLYVPLDIELRICCYPGYDPPDVKENLLAVFGSSYLDNGEKAFFHPDNFSFGEPLYLSRLYTSALSVAGVASAQALRFKRWDKVAHNELQEGVLKPSEMEILRCDTDPNYPENGKITFDVYGA